VIVEKRQHWIAHLFAFRGTAVRRIWLRLAEVTVVAVTVTYLYEKHGFFAEGITTLPFTLIGLALGIFLGFRNNTSYDRFWEGRKLWGRLVNTSRTLTRQLMTLIGPGPDSGGDPQLQAIHQEMVYRVIAYVHAFRCHLRDQPFADELAPFLPADEIDALEGESNVPIALLHRIGQRVRELYDSKLVHPLHMNLLEESLATLTDIQGGCERIKATPIPKSYNTLMHRLVSFYVFALPFGVVQQVGVFTPEVTILVAYAFLGLDAIGEEIEEPFGVDPNDLPLSAMSRMIEVNLRQRLGETDVPALHQPVDGILQ
jgi:putative membrane protein